MAMTTKSRVLIIIRWFLPHLTLLLFSCWAFSAVAAMEGAFNQKNNGTVPSLCKTKCGKQKKACCSFSEQEIVDCTLDGKDNCNKGGEIHNPDPSPSSWQPYF